MKAWKIKSKGVDQFKIERIKDENADRLRKERIKDGNADQFRKFKKEISFIVPTTGKQWAFTKLLVGLTPFK